ncbi:hypothetical protein Desaci_3121 [Desulfosporosinus acidiphilus SJ4]|uniref:DUF4878 domain-containing protein n=1 Tax=Desulfosporosinus acidiphilus (strain DSM 22704 / JCM 16185 / SJ4) TaxID=646529 RepID=I4D8A1_DESAJ|nr:hypothetical protein [Desulfosporosinus acidiphilus]AFM42025.1 hypothetical protein Desaci_3121 [Desulfosporosinus acidiphilus SJ4]
MRQSRYVWILGLSIVCLFTIVMFQTPQTVISTMADPHFQSNPRTTIQHFWSLMDRRQTDLAQDLLLLPKGSRDDQEFKTWAATLNKDPLLSLQKVELLNSEQTAGQEVIVRVSWLSPNQEVQSATFAMGLKQTENGWRIQKFKRINTLS